METLYAALPIVILIVLMGFMKVAGDKSSVVGVFGYFRFRTAVGGHLQFIYLWYVEGAGTHSFYHFDGDIQLQCPAAYSENRGVETAIFCHLY